ncbi:MAG: glycosyltransferase [Candidatus Omnitrophica bacterium]|nr:glycosyltransferase [Candidatus Omnitrophota bacterium]
MSRGRILFIATHPKEVASTRYRVLAYLPALEKAGFEVQVEPFFSSEDLQGTYRPQGPDGKMGKVLKASWKRWMKLRRSSADLIFIHRELFPWGVAGGMALLFPLLREKGRPLIYDFDDAVYLPHRQHHPFLGKLENPASVNHLLTACHQIIAGNLHLAQYAHRWNSRVEYLPTPVDTDRLFPSSRIPKTTPCTIGWIGSPFTAKYLESLLPALDALAQKRAFRLKVIGAGKPIHLHHAQVENRPWNLFTEAEEFRSCDIGVYPLWDDEWSKGKCGFKALQFMASGVPVVASAVGMNVQILQHGKNGFLAKTPEDWLAHLARMIDDPSLRREMSLSGRQTVEEDFSLRRLTPRFLQTIENTLDGKAKTAFPALPSAMRASSKRHAILCFSSIDWDFVWQGHQEIMSSLAEQGHRVLFIENTGVRNPRFTDLPRIKHRLHQWRFSLQGFRRENENLYVFSPLVIPFPYSRLARWINRWLLASALQRWVRYMDFDKPICWVFLPTPITWEVSREIPCKALIYYCIDSFPDSTPAAQRIVPSEDRFLHQADLVFVTSQKLYERASRQNREVHLFPFGVNLEVFDRARNQPMEPMEELKDLRRPIVGYVGGVHQWVDQELLGRLARRCRNYSFVLVGPAQSDTERLQREPNIFLLGQKPHDELPRYLKEFDVGIIPYRITEYTKNVYPTKLNEYHAMGKPVVSTPLPEVLSFNRRYGDLVRIGSNEETFHAAIERVLHENTPQQTEQRIRAAQDNSWNCRIEQMQALIEKAIARKQTPSAQAPQERTAARWIVRSFAAAGLFALALFHTPMVWWVAESLTVTAEPRSADAIVVFAGGVGESGEVSEAYQYRVKQAVELYHQGYAPKILYVSGYTWTFREAEIMRLLTESLEVPSEKVLTETEVRNTYDYVLHVKELSRRNRWKTILLVTPSYHARRAWLTFARNAPGLTVIPVSARSNYYTHRWGISLRQLRGILQEFVSLGLYKWRGWI